MFGLRRGAARSHEHEWGEGRGSKHLICLAARSEYGVGRVPGSRPTRFPSCVRRRPSMLRHLYPWRRISVSLPWLVVCLGVSGSGLTGGSGCLVTDPKSCESDEDCFRRERCDRSRGVCVSRSGADTEDASSPDTDDDRGEPGDVSSRDPSSDMRPRRMDAGDLSSAASDTTELSADVRRWASPRRHTSPDTLDTSGQAAEPTTRAIVEMTRGVESRR